MKAKQTSVPLQQGIEHKRGQPEKIVKPTENNPNQTYLSSNDQSQDNQSKQLQKGKKLPSSQSESHPKLEETTDSHDTKKNAPIQSNKLATAENSDQLMNKNQSTPPHARKESQSLKSEPRDQTTQGQKTQKDKSQNIVSIEKADETGKSSIPIKSTNPNATGQPGATGQPNATSQPSATQKQNTHQLFSQAGSHSECSPEQEVDCLEDILTAQIDRLIPQSISHAVERLLKLREQGVYTAFTENFTKYMDYQMERRAAVGDGIARIVQQLTEQRYNRVHDQLTEGKLMIHQDRAIKTKKEAQLMTQLETARLLRIRDGVIRNKVELLTDHVQQLFRIDELKGENEGLVVKFRQFNKAQSEQGDHRLDPALEFDYGPDSEKTKIAEEYVRHMQEQKRLLLQKRKEREEKQRIAAQQRERELKEAEQMRDLAKKQELLQKIQAARKIRELEEKQQTENQKKVEDLLMKYRRQQPIYRKNERQFNLRYKLPEQKARQQRLAEIRSERKSMSLAEIKTHEEKYLSLREKNIQKRAEEHQMLTKAHQAKLDEKKYFQGVFHQRSLQMQSEMKERSMSLRDAPRMQRHRILEYQKQVRTQFKPTVDEKKRQQLMEKINELAAQHRHRKKVLKQVTDPFSPDPKIQVVYEEIKPGDPHEQGKKFLQMSKALIKRDSNGNVIKTSFISDEEYYERGREQLKRERMQHESRISHSSQNIWEMRAHSLNQLTDIPTGDVSSFHHAKLNLEHLDQKAAKQEAIIKHGIVGVGQHIDEKAQLDNYYLESIKNKMRLLE